MSAANDAMEPLEKALLALNRKEVLGRVDAVIERTGASSAQQAVDAVAAALQIVGERFQDGEWFLGELVYAGEIAKEAMQKSSPLVAVTDGAGKGLVVVGTVRGDLHDLGKDIFGNYARSAASSSTASSIGASTESSPWSQRPTWNSHACASRWATSWCSSETSTFPICS